ncbi:MAG: hypothetical protein WCV83_04035 [Candidatus Magasanikbacteria bacterium]|jgi:hypothetical protein
MKLSQHLKYIIKTNWYKQGGAISLFYVLSAYHGFNENVGYENDILCQTGEINFAYFNKDEEKKCFLKVVSRQKKIKNI